MNLQSRIAAFSLSLLFTGCFFSWPSRGANERVGGQPFANAINPLLPASPRQDEAAGQDANSKASSNEADPLFPVVEGGKWGYIDKTGKIVIPPQYYSVREFSDGMAFVELVEAMDSHARSVDRLYLIDMAGNLNTTHLYRYADQFHDGLALVIGIDDRVGSYIDKTGRTVIPGQFSGSHGFHDGLADVMVSKKWGYIDKSGNVAITPQYDVAFGFTEGMAAVKVGKKWGYIDKSGKMVVPPQYETAYQYTEGLAAVKQGGKWGYIDPTGLMVIQPQFPNAYGFTQGLAEVEGGGKWGYIDKTGNVAISPQFEETSSYSEGLAAVKEGGKWGYIDKAGKIAIPFKYETAGTFSQGLARVGLDRKTGYIDSTGAYIWTPTK